ncbi:SDR family NAD(P)-dependent oxidoreductase [Blastococcus sp. PRF04-17]|nr:SDR family NAD(P)-dependent oxidoreductase [Blastococcus sp. PRF04-17]UOY03355.1 SDR family NAD(P)-dependent oxidoreductase [Blastococcus sp. PRF04-17]
MTVVARSTEQLDRTATLVEQAGGSCTTYPADLADIAAIPGHADTIGAQRPVDGVVHAAGVQRRRAAVDITVEDWRFVQTLNVEAPFFLSTAIARRQLADGRPGSHVFIGSLNSTIGLPRIAPYVASKTAVLGLARSLSTEWASAACAPT